MASLDTLDPSTVQPSSGPGEWANANPVSDPSLNALLADLQEGTFLSLMEDKNLFSDLDTYPLSPCDVNNAVNSTTNLSSNDTGLDELFGDQWQLVDFGLEDLDSGQSPLFQLPLNLNDSDVAKLVKVKSEGLPVPSHQEDYSLKKQDGITDATPREGYITPTASATVDNPSGNRLESEPVPVALVETYPTLFTRKRKQQHHTPAFLNIDEDKLASCRKTLKASRHRRDPSSSGSESDISSSDSDVMECEVLGKPRVGVKATANRDTVANVISHNRLLACVQHDHSYAMSQHFTGESPGGQGSPASTDGDAGTEEGSNSDAGYETMSASTSPGNHSTTTNTPSKQPPLPKPSPLPPPPSLPLPLPPLPPLGGGVDPVALIDARIQHFMCSRQVNLTEEEKETLKAEGLPIPTTLPLTKTEEKALKTVRRKIRNKLAAQESRKRKKENLHSLEDKVKQFTTENFRLKKRVETLETENKSLISQLRKLQAIVASSAAVANTNRTTQVGACLMVVVLCFAIFFGNWMPHKFWSTPTNDYTTATVRSRSLLSVENPHNFQQAACDWFRHIFFQDEGEIGPLEQSESRETHHRSDYRNHKTDIYTALTPLTTLQMVNATQQTCISVKA